MFASVTRATLADHQHFHMTFTWKFFCMLDSIVHLRQDIAMKMLFVEFNKLCYFALFCFLLMIETKVIEANRKKKSRTIQRVILIQFIITI